MQAPEQPHGVSDPILDWMESERFTETLIKTGITATLGVAVWGLNAQVLNPWIGILLTLCALALLGVLRLDPPLMRVQRAYRPIRQLAWVTLPPRGSRARISPLSRSGGAGGVAGDPPGGDPSRRNGGRQSMDGAAIPPGLGAVARFAFDPR